MPLPMGVIRFRLSRRDHLAADATDRAYMAGMDEVPWQTRTHLNEAGLDVQRAESDSGNFYIPCVIQGHGEVTLSTASLMEREQPYQLEVELARGTLNRLLNQVAAWQSLGMHIPQAVGDTIGQARERLARAATSQDEPNGAGERALESIRLALDAVELLNDAYIEQALAARHHGAAKLNTLLGVSLDNLKPGDPIAGQLPQIFNTALIPLVWREIEAAEGKRDFSLADQQIEWCRAKGLKICSGPLVRIDRWSLPDWMYLWGEGDEESFRSCVAEHVQAVVTHYRGKVQLWQCAAGLNIDNDFEQSEEERLRLAVLSIESIRRVDPRAPIVITIDQPWGTFMSREECDLSPLHFADALVRADLGLSGIGIEINFAYGLQGSESRTSLEFGRQIDRWSALGLPLLVTLTAPSSTAPDPLARSAARPINYSAAAALSPDAQRAWAEKFLPVLLSKQPVQGIIWNQLFDSQPHAFAHGGLLDTQQHAKPILESLGRLRRQHLA
jgi:glycosyl hydrolase family 10